MNRTTAAAVLLAALAVAACGTERPGDPGAGPVDKATTTTAPPSPTALSTADQIDACKDAIKDGRDEGEGAPECDGLSLDDYYEALHQANQELQEDFQQEIDDAEASANAGG